MIPKDMKPLSFFEVSWPDVTPYGFTWGPVRVERIANFKPRKDREAYVVGVNDLEIYVSKTGRSVRVFRGGRELK